MKPPKPHPFYVVWCVTGNEVQRLEVRSETASHYRIRDGQLLAKKFRRGVRDYMSGLNILSLRNKREEAECRMVFADEMKRILRDRKRLEKSLADPDSQDFKQYPLWNSSDWQAYRKLRGKKHK